MRRTLPAFLALCLGACQSTTRDTCCRGKTFEVVQLPYAITVSKDEIPVGVATVDSAAAITFTAAEGAGPADVAKVQTLIEKANKDQKVSYTYSDYAGDTHCKCGGEVASDSPQYPAAVKAALYSEYFEVTD